MERNYQPFILASDAYGKTRQVGPTSRLRKWAQVLEEHTTSAEHELLDVERQHGERGAVRPLKDLHGVLDSVTVVGRGRQHAGDGTARRDAWGPMSASVTCSEREHGVQISPQTLVAVELTWRRSRGASAQLKTESSTPLGSVFVETIVGSVQLDALIATTAAARTRRRVKEGMTMTRSWRLETQRCAVLELLVLLPSLDILSGFYILHTAPEVYPERIRPYRCP